MIIRELQRHEIETIWSIDRSEVIDNIYYYEDGELVLRPEHYDMHGWPPDGGPADAPLFYACYDRGGTFYGAFDDGDLVGVAVLEAEFIGRNEDQLQLMFMHVSQGYRGQGVGTTLFEMAAEKARALGARQLYVSATPSENTVHFYLGRGCVLADEVDPDLYEMEPEDIHLTYTIPPLGEGDA